MTNGAAPEGGNTASGRLDHAAQQLSAAWAMVFDQDGWRDRLDCSLEGVFRSALAIAIAAPLALLNFLGVRRLFGGVASEPFLGAPLPMFLAVEFAALLVDWGVCLALLVGFARALKAERRVAPLIVGYNWSQVFVIAAQGLPIGAAALTGSLTTAGLAAIPALAFQLAVIWGVLRRALGAPNAPVSAARTIAMMAALVLTGFLINSAFGMLGRAMIQSGS